MHLTFSQLEMPDASLCHAEISRLQQAAEKLGEAIAILDSCRHLEVAAAYADSAAHIVQCAIEQGGSSALRFDPQA